ncbi:hypothetical protein NQ317_007616 [Molorchus minor]|uniref:C2H2-type domain-containing protein n=1 Tax=Molorchus minor TaxID=1323400 RepID=A0ABQ9J0H6_9CUCU|nr:hypothetical protein NQ317_007616 [Molorchus minor]
MLKMWTVPCWGKYFPELDLTLTEDPEICPPCLKSLQQYLHDIDHYVNILKDAKGDDLNKIKDSTSSDKEEFLSEQKAASSKSRNLRKRKRVIINEKASDEGKFQCAHCAYEATTRSRILRHLLKHRESDLKERKIPKLTCDQCGFQCRSADMFKGHIRSHQIPSTKSKTKCGECSFQSNWAQNLRRHQLTHLKDFPTEMIMYKCKICQYKSRRKYLVKEHVLTHNEGSGDGNEEDDPQNTLIEVVKYQCDICENQCENNVEFEEHMKGHKLSSDNSTYKCHLCSYTTRIKQKLKVHMVVHKSISEVTHLCHICAFKTKRKGDLKVHVLSHNNKDRQTSDGIKLNEHKLAGRNPPKTKLYRCKECSFGGRNHYSLLKHKIAAHNTVLEQYQCDRCNYSTHIKSIFKRHAKTHENISVTYKCNICSFNTSNKNKLRQHISNDHRRQKRY